MGAKPIQPQKRLGRALIVDDEPAVRELVARHYRRAGYQVVSASSAEEVKTRGHTGRDWDIVVTDIHLPGLSGIELARSLSERSRSLVLMTGDHDRALAGEALRDLRAGYLLKPFEMVELDALVRANEVNGSGGSGWWSKLRRKKAEEHIPDKQSVPASALLVSILAMLAPIATMLAPEATAPLELLLWVCAMIPPFLLAYHRGWRGAAAALALGMATLALLQSSASVFELQMPTTMIGLGVNFVASCFGAGWLSNQLHARHRQAEHLAMTDALTGLPNRAHIESYLNARFAAGKRGRGRAAVVFFDLDHFKRWNDELGHEVGDEALRAFADVLRKVTRQSDMVGRYGGEEFIAVLDAQDFGSNMVYVDRIRSELREIELYGRKVTVSIGIAFQEPWMVEPGELITAADAAVYAAKAAGRDCVRLAESIIGDLVDGARASTMRLVG